MADQVPSSYRSLLSVPGAVGFSLAAFVGRMPIAMLGIGSVLLVEDRRGSLTLAGLVAASYGAGAALISPAVSRQVDRHGQRRVLPAALLVSVAATVALVLGAGAAVPAGLLCAAAAAAGGALPPLGACVRTRWSGALRERGREEDLPAAFALESVVDEVVFVLGPVLVVSLAITVDPAFGLLAAATLSAAGTVAFVAQRASEPPVRLAAGSVAGAWRVVGLRTIALSMVFVGTVFGGLEVVMVAFSVENGQRAAAGVLLPLVALGSAVAGLVYGGRRWRAPLHRRYRWALLGLAVGCVPVLLAGGVVAMAPAALLAGVAISPTLIAATGLIEQLVPAEARTEGFTWLHSAIAAGTALGAAAGGAVADASGARLAFLTCLVGALLALAVAVVGRRTLLPEEPVAAEQAA